MEPTKKELDEVPELNSWIFSIVEALAPLIQPIFRIGFLKRGLANTAGGRIGMIARLAERGDHEGAAALAVETLKDRFNQENDPKILGQIGDWWTFLDLAASSLEECGNNEEKQELIELATRGAKPYQGYYASRSFLAFSRWKYSDGDFDKAIEFAEIAANADKTWAEPDFVSGWLGLVLEGSDPVQHLTQAIRKNPQMIFRIASDPEIRKYPHIVRRLKDLSGDSIVSVQDNPNLNKPSGSTA